MGKVCCGLLVRRKVVGAGREMPESNWNAISERMKRRFIPFEIAFQPFSLLEPAISRSRIILLLTQRMIPQTEKDETANHPFQVCEPSVFILRLIHPSSAFHPFLFCESSFLDSRISHVGSKQLNHHIKKDETANHPFYAQWLNHRIIKDGSPNQNG